MKGDDASTSVDDTELRLRRALAATAELPRPLIKPDPELPPELIEFVSEEAAARLRSAAVLVPVIRRRQTMVLLTRRADSLRHHRGQISFPGGARDAGDDSATTAALREAREEIGLDPAQVEIIGYLDDYPTITDFRVTPVVGYISADFHPQPSPDEVAEVFEVPLSVLLDPQHYRHKTFQRMGFAIPYYELHYRHYRIWGATAGMLWDLCQRVERNGRQST